MCVKETEGAVYWPLAPCLSVRSDQSCLPVVCPLPAVKRPALGMPTDERMQPCSRINPALLIGHEWLHSACQELWSGERLEEGTERDRGKRDRHVSHIFYPQQQVWLATAREEMVVIDMPLI